ncbi:phage tail tape measure protein [Pseudochrobactrum asaccharolyticum]|uniref:TP901 family phage tail tape measure protein n=1 Tax=Pseudochrobactrum asaccharolyticum TaxID=354351 RepID=A0A366DHV1_9HYPH|nr:phage tail tape measure protein [Pseudochrobactrum asaccharolyticum]RBO89662.1 TP901 family phage tail tape measure protein [Pseudochrobactrum asaccharolyticum]
MSTAILNISVKLDGAEAADSKLKSIEGQSKRTESATDSLTGSFGKLASGLAAFAATAFTMDRVATTIAGFEHSMSAVKAITRANADEMIALRDVAKELGSTTEYSASQAADALKFLGMAGFQAKDSIAAIPDVLDLATASSMGLAEAADISSNIMSGFGLSANQAGEAADILAAASTRANTDVLQLGDAMKYAAPVAHSLGISMGDTAAAIGVMSDAGIQGSQAGTGLRAVLASLVKPSKEGEVALKAMGLTMKDVNPQTKSLADIFKLLQERGLNAEAAMMLFGREAASAGLAMAGASSRLGELSTQLRDVNGEAKRMADTMRDNLQGDFNNLSSAAEGLIIALGEAGLESVLRSTIQAVTDLVGVFSDMAVYLPEAAYVVGTLATAFGVNLVLSLGATAAASFNAAASIAGLTTTAAASTLAINTLRGSIGLLNSAFTAMGGPVGVIIGALGLAVYAFNQRARESADSARYYAEAIKIAGDNSQGATGGIEAAARSLYDLGAAATEAQKIVALEAATRRQAILMADLEEAYNAAGRGLINIKTAMSGAYKEAGELIHRFKGGEISAEELTSALDKLAATNPSFAGWIAELQNLAKNAAAARGEIAALAQFGPNLPEGWGEQQGPQLPEGWTKPTKVPELNLPASGGGRGSSGGGSGTSEADKIADEMKSRLEALKSGLQSEMEAKIEAYAKDMETLKWYLDNKKMTEEEYEMFKDQIQEKAFERALTEEERQISEYERQLEMLKNFLEQKKITEEEYNRWREQITAEHEQKMRDLRMMAYADALGGIGDVMGAMASVVGSNNEKMLKAQRIFGAASALISTYVGAAEALKLGFPQNLAAMATVLAKGMSLVAAIKSGSKLSASGGGGSAGTTQAAAPREKAPLRQMAQITLHGGEMHSTEAVAKLFGKMNEMMKDGYVLDVKVT